MTLYHYTTKDNFDNIVQTKTLSASTPWTSQDHTYGDGWYFTDLDPQKCDIAIALQCWQNEDAINKVQYYLKFDVDTSISTFCRENVYIVKQWDSKKIRYIEGKKIPHCEQRPCSKCSKGKNIIQRFFDKLFKHN
jgi:hypothetical protein